MIPPSSLANRSPGGPVDEPDLEPLRHWYNAPETFRYMGRNTPLDATSQLAWFDHSRHDPASCVWAIDRADTHSLIGSITLRNLTDPARRGVLGVLLGVSGSGFGSDSVGTVLAYVFSPLTLQCVSLEVRGDDPRAITAYMRAGFRPEGILRRRLLKDGQRHDLYAMSILREEYEAAALKF